MDGANVSSWRPYQARPERPPLNKANARELHTRQASGDDSNRPDNTHQRKRPRLAVRTSV